MVPIVVAAFNDEKACSSLFQIDMWLRFFPRPDQTGQPIMFPRGPVVNLISTGGVFRRLFGSREGFPGLRDVI